MQYQTRHSSPSIPRDSAPRLWGRGPSPTFPTLPGRQPAPSFPTCFLPPVPVFCEAAVPPISLLGRTSLGSSFSQTLLLPNGRAPAGGGRVLGDPRASSTSVPVGFLPTLSGTFSCRPPPELSPDDSISPSHPFHSWPSLTSLLQLLPVTFPSPDPFPSLLSQFLLPSPFLRLRSTQPRVPYLYPHYSLCTPPFLTQLSLSKTVPVALSFTTLSL